MVLLHKNMRVSVIIFIAWIFAISYCIFGIIVNNRLSYNNLSNQIWITWIIIITIGCFYLIAKLIKK